MVATLAAVILRIFANPLGNAFQKRLTAQKRSPLWVNFATFALLSIACVVPASTVDWTRFSPQFWEYCVLTGVLCAVGNACLVAALQRGELSVLGPINAWKSLFAAAGAFIFLGEIPSFAAFCGIAAIIAGSYFVLNAAPGRLSLRSLVGDAAIRLRVAATILSATEAVFIKKIVVLSSPNVAFYVWAGLGATFSFATLLFFRVNWRRELAATLTPRRAATLGALVFCVGATQQATNFVFARLNVGCALALFQLSTLVGVWFGVRFFHERDFVPKALGSCATIAGSIVVILFD